MTTLTSDQELAMTPSVSEHGTLPLAPIDRPKNPFVWLMYLMTRLRYGKTPTAFRVVYARKPMIGLVTMMIVTVAELFLSLDRELRFLVNLSIAMRQGCTFCADLTLAEAMRHRIGRERFRDLLDAESSGAFTEREKAILAYTEALHRSPHIEDAILARLKASFSEREIVEIVWLSAVERYFNSMALPLRIGSDELAQRG